MRISKFLLGVPFVLVSLMADKGGPAGGGGSAAPAPAVFAPPAWAPADKAPTAEGESIESKLESSTGIIGKLFTSLGTALADFKTLWTEKEQLSRDFTALQGTAQAEKEAHQATKDLLETEKGEHAKTKGDLTKSNKSVERLESLCDLKGIDKNQVVAPEGKGGADDVVAQYADLRAQEKAGEIDAGTAHKFYRKHKKEIDSAATPA